MLTLPIKKKWFDMILSGEKKEEYREIKSYYDKRFSKIILPSGIVNCYINANLKTGKIIEIQNYQTILFRNGYSSNSPTISCRVKIEKGYGKEEWGAEPNKLYYVLKILSVEEIDDK